MKLFPLLCLLALSLVREGTSTHHETCECHEISELVNASVQQAAARLEYKLGIMIDTAISNINTTISNINTTVYTAISNTTDEAALSNLESRLTSAIQGLLKPIRNQLDYHLPQPPPPGKTADDPGISCKDLYDTYYASSDYYWIGEVGSAVRVYCNMSLTCGNMKGGWMRVANLDMTNTSQNCPIGLHLTTSPKRVCDIPSSGCVSNDFDIHGVQYSHICGRVIGYQHFINYGFLHHSRGIDSYYVNGVSLTHGQSPRQHIWTFAGTLDENTQNPGHKCPCINPNLDPTPTLPSFIGNDYFCDTALANWNTYSRRIEVGDPLWDGEGCGPTNTCCYDPDREVNPPWFVKTLSSPTSDDIEMRLCAASGGNGYSTPIEIVELYVQ